MELIFPSHPAVGADGDVFWAALLDCLNSYEQTLQLLENELENTVDSLFGKGILYNSYSGSLLQVGTGLNLLIKAHTTIDGFASILTLDRQEPMPASSTKYIWEFQQNSDVLPDYGLTDTLTDPSTSVEKAILLGQIITSGSAVTGITPLFNIVYPLSYYVGSPPAVFIPREETFALSWDADADTRTGGTIYAVTVTHAPIGGYPVIIRRGNAVMINTEQVTISGSTMTFLDNYKPIADEKVIVDYYSAT